MTFNWERKGIEQKDNFLIDRNKMKEMLSQS